MITPTGGNVPIQSINDSGSILNTKGSSKDENSIIAKITSFARKFFEELPLAAKLAIGLTLIGTSVVIATALSPKLALLAAIIAAIGIAVLTVSALQEIAK